MRDSAPVFLIGFMGCGKSTLGRRLADMLGFRFVDADALIEERAGKSISRIFAEEGEVRFRELEHQLLLELLQQDQVLVATGGGMPCYTGNMASIKQGGRSVFLSVAPESLLCRLRHETAQRPLLAQKTDEELLPWISRKLAERLPIYQQADYLVDADREMDKVLEDLKKWMTDEFV